MTFACSLLVAQDVDNLWSSLSAVLHIGNIEFQAVGNQDAAQISNPAVVRKGWLLFLALINVCSYLYVARPRAIPLISVFGIFPGKPKNNLFLH